MQEQTIINNVVLAEAAAWLARLQGARRTPAVEAAFRDWLAASPEHARAFARVTDTWDIIPGAAAIDMKPRRRRLGQPALALAACVALVAISAAFLLGRPDTVEYKTARGEQQTVILEDGSRVALNTDSQIMVQYTGSRRLLNLERGEALFEVEKQPSRPFIVKAGGEQVKALGTTFVVRRDARQLSVSLIEGRVEIGPAEGKSTRPFARALTVLSPGQRATIASNGELRRIDAPRMDEVTAWRGGEVMFDDATLTAAISEMHRYGSPNIRLAEPELANLRISGVFSTRDTSEFANAVAELHDLSLSRAGNDIVLGRRVDRQ